MIRIAFGTSVSSSDRQTGCQKRRMYSPIGVPGPQWVSSITPVARTEVSEPARYTLRFGDDSNAEIRFDCNVGGGRYEIDGNRLSFGPLMSTRMACPPDSMDALFMEQLSHVSSYFVRDGSLYLELAQDSGTMRFSRPAEQD